MRLRLEDVLDPGEEISARALLLVLADEVLANAGTGPAADERTRAVADRLRVLTVRGASWGTADGLQAATPDALGSSESDLFAETWDSSTKTLALVQALAERLVPMIAAADGQDPATVAKEIEDRAQELDRAEGGGRVMPDRWPLTRWGPDPAPGASAGG